jgi:hypothetical protein
MSRPPLTWQQEIEEIIKVWVRTRQRKVEAESLDLRAKALNGELAKSAADVERALKTLRRVARELVQHPADRKTLLRRIASVGRAFEPWQAWYRLPTAAARPAHRPAGDRFFRDACRGVMKRHSVTATAVAQEVVRHVKRRPALLSDLVAGGSDEDRIKTLADRLRRDRK